MQLIFDIQPIEGIKITMSTQAESPANEGFSDIKRTAINNVSKEININEGTVASPEICLINKSENAIDRVTPEIIKDSALKDKCLSNTNGKDNKKCNLEVIDPVNESDLIDNINSILNENITNGTSSGNDETESEYEKGNEKISIENVLSENKDANPQINPTSNTKEILESFTKKDDVQTKDEHSKLELFLSADTTNCLSKDIVPKDSSPMFTADVDLKKQEMESSSNEKEVTIEVINTTVVKENESVKVSKSEDSIVVDEGKNDDKISSNDTPPSVLKIQLADIFKNDQAVIPDNNILINDEKAAPKNIILMSSETDTLLDQTTMKNKTLSTIGSVKDSEEITMEEGTDNTHAVNSKTDNHSKVLTIDDLPVVPEVPVDITLKNETDTVTSKPILEHAKVTIIDLRPIEDVMMHEEIDKVSEVSANTAMFSKTATETVEIISQEDKLATNDIIPDAVIIDDDMDNTSEIISHITPNSKLDTLNEDLVLDHTKLSLSDGKKIEDISMDEEIDKNKVPEGVPINKEINLPVADKKVEVITINEKNITGSHNNVKQNLTLKNTKHSESVALENDELVLPVKDTLESDDCVSVQNENISPDLNGPDLKVLPEMEEACDISVVVSTATSVNESIIIDDTEQVSDKSSESDLDTLKGDNESDMGTIKVCEKVDDDNEVEHVPMEVDEIEIVDLDKENQDENISEGMTSTDIVNIDETNVEIIEPEITISEKLIRKIDVNVKKTEASIKTNNDIVVPIINETKRNEDHEKVEIIDEDDIKIIENKTIEISTKTPNKEQSLGRKETKTLPVVCKLSNTLDILSDDEDEPSKLETTVTDNSDVEKQCINIDDDDDIMLIDEDSNSKDAANEDKTEVLNDEEETQTQSNNKIDLETGEKETIATNITDLSPNLSEKESPALELDPAPIVKNISEGESGKSDKKSFISENILKNAKKNIAEMTRDELEEFCILRIAEGIIDGANLNGIIKKMKIMSQSLDEFRRRAVLLSKQNRDLQVVLKSVQEEQKKRTNVPIQPLKITRSVGMQVVMNEKIDPRRKGLIPCQSPSGTTVRALPPKSPGTPTPLPVPKKVLVNNTPAKSNTITPTNNIANVTSPSPGLRQPSPVQKAPEKRSHTRMQASPAVTVDLTDDEPPAKINNKNSPVAPVRVVPPLNLLPQQRAFTQPLNSPRKVYIPISGPQGQAVQAIRPGQTLMMKSMQVTGPRQRGPAMPRMQQSSLRVAKSSTRHPAPLPDAMKQYTPPTWKSLPPAPDLKLSKVENGIVISWKIDGYPEGGYETIASYQLYAYQETTAPPCTALWKKIGDVKALPLPMACTLTQFMAGFKYYFAVRAVDVRSRLGPFSLPGSILLLNKV